MYLTFYTILYYTILYYTILYYTILYYTILYYTILYYTILYCSLCNCDFMFHILYYAVLCSMVTSCSQVKCWLEESVCADAYAFCIPVPVADSALTLIRQFPRKCNIKIQVDSWNFQGENSWFSRIFLSQDRHISAWNRNNRFQELK